ncbi:MAG: hypothetical protein ACRDLM_02965 [Gaiellaceae bacterium]
MTDVEALVLSELHRMLPLPDGGRADWGDVLRRAGLSGSGRLPRRRALLLVGAAAVVVLAIAVPAFGLAHSMVDWFSAAPAPEPAQRSFQSLDIGAPAGMAPGVSGPARSVIDARVNGKDVHLWVAPTASGGFCLLLENSGGGCDRDRQLPIALVLDGGTEEIPPVVFGDALPSGVDHIQVAFANGQSVSIPVVYVSPPIDASFFVYQLSGTGSHPADWPATFDAIRSDGTVVASTTMGKGVGIPPTAVTTTTSG